jgi:hypothetical protein
VYGELLIFGTNQQFATHKVRLFMYDRTTIGSRRWEPVGDLAKTAEDISKYIDDSGSPQATIIRDEVTQPPS